MLGRLGQLLFPNHVEVLEIVPQRQYVYPIFKNGTTSLKETDYPTVGLANLRDISNIEVFVRNPHERFLSGVQTYIKKLGPGIDKKTALYFLNQIHYVDRHCCPQLYWLLNLNRFTNATITLRPIDELVTITTHHLHQSTVDPEIQEFFSKNKNLLFFNEMDEVLTVNLIGKTVTLEQILTVFKENYTELYNDTFDTGTQIINALPQT
jgi:hypothetical protein